MEDIKQIQEFFSKPLNEEKEPLDIIDLAKVVKAVQQTGHPVTVLLVPKFNEIEVLTGMNAPDDMLRDLSNAVDSLGYGRNDIIIAGDSSNLSRREYSDIRRVNGGAKDYFEESVNEMDMNDPILMKMRAAKDKLAKMRAANAGDDGNDKFFDNAKKIAFLKKEREQLMRDMEQEAEPEGGPIADEYGDKLNRIDAAIAKLSGRKEMTYDQAIAEELSPKDFPVNFTYGGTTYVFNKIAKDRAVYYNPRMDGDIAVFRSREEMDSFLDDYTSPRGGTQSSQFEAIAEGESKMPTQDQVDKFFALTQNETHYLNSKPVEGQVKTFNKMEVEPWDEYDLSNWNSLVRKAKQRGKSIDEGNDKIKDLEQLFDFHTQMDNKGQASIIKDKIEKLRKLSNSGEIDGDEFLDKFNPLQKQLKSIDEELNLPDYGKVTPPKGGASLAGQYNSIQGKSKYDTVIFDYQEGSDKPYGIVQVEGHGIYGSDLLKRLGLRQTKSWTAGVDVYIHDGNNNPVYVSKDDFKALLDFWSGGLDREAKAQADFYRGRGNTSGTIDEATEEEENEFHKDLDKLVHKTFGHSSDEKKKSMAQELAETIKLGEGVIEEELCPKGKAYIKRRKAAGEKSSAYLSGRAVKVCKGQMSGRKKKK